MGRNRPQARASAAPEALEPSELRLGGDEPGDSLAVADGSRSGEAELVELRRQLERLPERVPFNEVEIGMAREICDLRARIVEALGDVRACRTCAKGLPLPVGRWSGGKCCAHRVEKLFCKAELEIVRAANIDGVSLDGPCGDAAGCVFRSPQGCALAAGLRPSPCVAYLCEDLAAELRARGDLDQVERFCRELETSVQRFTTTHSMREMVAELRELL